MYYKPYINYIFVLYYTVNCGISHSEYIFFNTKYYTHKIHMGSATNTTYVKMVETKPV